MPGIGRPEFRPSPVSASATRPSAVCVSGSNSGAPLKSALHAILRIRRRIDRNPAVGDLAFDKDACPDAVRQIPREPEQRRLVLRKA